MIAWLSLSDDQRKNTISEAEIESGIPSKAIEKDWWVTLVLKALFQGQYGKYMVFKGGTSLSKGWGLISRFSEDIDIALDPEAFGIKHVQDPDSKFINNLKRKGCEFTSTALKDELEQQLLSLGLVAGTVEIIAAEVRPDVPDTDPQTLYVKYKSLYPPNPYLKDEVKIEVSVRSLLTPSEPRNMLSLLSEFKPNQAYAETPFAIETVHPRKTFIEKVFLLHEEFQRKDKSKIKVERKSRHYYDLYSTSQAGIFEQAFNDNELYAHIIEHRQRYNTISWVDYSQLAHETVSFIPPDELIEIFQSDYKSMRTEMIHGESVPSFEQIMFHLKKLQALIKMKNETYNLEQVIEQALLHFNTDPFFTAKEKKEGVKFSVPVHYFIDANGTPYPEQLIADYLVNFSIWNGKPTLESIQIIQ